MIKYRHIKSGKIYFVIGFALNSTNKDDGQKMVIYRPENNPDTIFVREMNEFGKKFESMEWKN